MVGCCWKSIYQYKPKEEGEGERKRKNIRCAGVCSALRKPFGSYLNCIRNLSTLLDRTGFWWSQIYKFSRFVWRFWNSHWQSLLPHLVACVALLLRNPFTPHGASKPRRCPPPPVSSTIFLVFRFSCFLVFFFEKVF